jgi:ribose transport system ATP-binding protein
MNVAESPAAASGSAGTPVLRVRELSKSFVGRTVLSKVALDVAPGEVVGLLGQNGSGKSTLIKVVSGYHAPDAGSSVEVNGVALDSSLGNSGLADLDMAFVHQNLGLFDDSSVLDNLMANRWVKRGGHIRWRALRASGQALLDDFGLDVDLDAPVSALTQGDKAVLAIARAVGELAHLPSGLLVLDEPTPYLARAEVQRLFAAMRSAAERGIGILFVSHRLDEVRDVTDRVVVLRDGSVVADRATADLSDDELVELIVGRAITDFYPTVPVSTGETVLAVHDLAARGDATLSFDIRRGEIVGMTGLLGSGFEVVPYALAGDRAGTAGTLVIDGEAVDIATLTPPAAISHGLALVPADRSRLGVAGTMSVGENISLPWVDRLTRGVRIDRAAERTAVSELLDRFDVRPRDADALMETLSGGNQQKTVLARWIAEQPRVLLLHEPTQGVDVGARQQIFAVIRDAVEQGMSVLYCSLEYEDLAHMCDRVHVFRDGQIVAELMGSEISAERIADVSLRQATA